MRSGAVGSSSASASSVERLAAGREVAGPPQLVRRQRLGGVAGHGLHQGALVAPARHRHADRPTALQAQPVGQDRDLPGLGQRGHQDAPRHVGVRLGVHLGQQGGDELCLVSVIDAFDDESALATDPAIAHVEDPHARLELVAGEPDDVGVRAVGQDHGVALEHPLQGVQVVAKPGSALVVQLGGRGVHLLGPGADERCRVAGHERAEVLDDRAMLLRRDLPGAGRGALVDVAQQAGPPRGLGAAEHPARAGAHREHPQQLVDRLADRPRVGERAEVAHARAASHRA